MTDDGASKNAVVPPWGTGRATVAPGVPVPPQPGINPAAAMSQPYRMILEVGGDNPAGWRKVVMLSPLGGLPWALLVANRPLRAIPDRSIWLSRVASTGAQ